MKPSNRIALTLSLSAALFCASALAEDAAAAPAAPAAKHHRHKAKKVIKSARYDQCLRENMADAEYFCSSHPDGCQAEKDGVATQCRSEARGEKQKG